MEKADHSLELLFGKYLDNSISKEEYEVLWKVMKDPKWSKEIDSQLEVLWVKAQDAKPYLNDNEWNRKLREMIWRAEAEDIRVRQASPDEASLSGSFGQKYNPDEASLPGSFGQKYNPDETSLPGSFGDDSPDEAAPVRMLRKWLAAAVLVGLLGFGIWFINSSPSESVDVPVAQSKDVQAPDRTKATIKLADGSVVLVDEAGGGVLAQQGNVKVVKDENGAISYELEDRRQKVGDRSEEMIYNTLFNPRGSRVIDIKLADGSRVWLNAGSSVTYPVAFLGNERKVTIEGEAYFEVVKAHPLAPSRREGGRLRDKIPFHVESGGVVTEVLGTHFNVKAYGDESVLKVTLLEGSVAVKTDKERKMLEPGEQGQIPLLWIRSGAAPKPLDDGQRGSISVVKNIDVEEVMAWKNGVFYFNGADLQTIMREIGRWYDVDVVYQGKVSNEKFKGEISRNVPASKVLQMLEYLGVRFKIEGKKVVVGSSESRR